MSVLSVALSIRIRRVQKFGSMFHVRTVLARGMTKLNQTVKMESSNPVAGYFGSEFLAICSHCVVMAVRSSKTLQILN